MSTKSLMLVVALLSATTYKGATQPIITKQPTNQSVSLGASVKFQVFATSTDTPLYFQWRFATTNLPGARGSSLTLTNIQFTNAGDYDALLTDGSGSVTSHVAHLEVDATFTKITTGQIVTDGGYSWGCAWGDYNNDGFIDLFVCNTYDDFGGQHDFLYRNNTNGTFTRITTGLLVNGGIQAFCATWGDYDNDGYLDLFVGGSTDGSTPGANRLYHNNGNGTFSKITTGLLVTQPLRSHAGVWADFDNDGLTDLFVVNFRIFGSGVPANDNYLYRNTGEGTFNRVSFGTKSLTNGDSWNVAAADFNNDGWIDLFVPQGEPSALKTICFTQIATRAA